MRLHANARTCPKNRREIVRRFLAGRSRECIGAEFAVSTRTVSKWVARYRSEGELGLMDRSSAPRLIAHRTPAARMEAIAALRRVRMTSTEIAEVLGMPCSTVSAVLGRIGLGKLSRLDPFEPPNRYERRHPGELLHIDVKKIGRIPTGRAGQRVHGQRWLQRSPRRRDAAGRDRRRVGWEFVHVCVDDATRLAYAEVLPNEQAITAVAFLRRARAFYLAHGIRV